MWVKESLACEEFLADIEVQLAALRDQSYELELHFKTLEQELKILDDQWSMLTDALVQGRRY